jgi:HSP20 family molecular chaperone IbpA
MTTLITTSLMDRVMMDFDRMWNEMFTPVCKLPATLVSNRFPPCDYYADEDGTLHFDFAVAGYKEDEISLKFEDDHLILILSPKKEEKKEGRIFQKAIKISESTTKVYVPFSKYDVAKVDATLEDGMLKVVIPSKEEAKPVAVKINTK